MSLPGTDGLRRDFSRERVDRRVLSLVSPTCTQCLAGLRLVLDEIADVAGVAVFVLWLAMLESDGPGAADRAANELGRDGAVRHYWEEEGWPTSTHVRAVLGIGPHDPAQSAWDVHLLYRLDAEWDGDAPPRPTAWAYNGVDDLGVGERLSASVVRRWLDD